MKTKIIYQSQNLSTRDIIISSICHATGDIIVSAFSRSAPRTQRIVILVGLLATSALLVRKLPVAAKGTRFEAWLPYQQIEKHIPMIEHPDLLSAREKSGFIMDAGTYADWKVDRVFENFDNFAWQIGTPLFTTMVRPFMECKPGKSCAMLPHTMPLTSSAALQYSEAEAREMVYNLYLLQPEPFMAFTFDIRPLPYTTRLQLEVGRLNLYQNMHIQLKHTPAQPIPIPN